VHAIESVLLKIPTERDEGCSVNQPNEYVDPEVVSKTPQDANQNHKGDAQKKAIERQGWRTSKHRFIHNKRY
ncbi:MAG: hypothetical protein K2Z81_19690, partial [Cyanobacteria bacterium]|nr:hypothetical protein [Cyanobacteriota bacterium]